MRNVMTPNTWHMDSVNSEYGNLTDMKFTEIG
jgi:hypothetical protein